MAASHSDTDLKATLAAIADSTIDIGIDALEAIKNGMLVAIADLNAEWMTEAEASAEEAAAEAIRSNLPPNA